MSTEAPPLPPQPEVMRITDDTYLVPTLLEAPPVGLVYLNSMVITGKEPVLVDTGPPMFREDWLRKVWSIVDPKDVRWIFLSHDDRDHAGNLMQVLEACPNAKLVTTWFSIGRMADEWSLPMDRVRLVYDRESFDAGDRTLAAVRPPFFDSPTTLGLFDAKNRLLWSVDTFAMFMPSVAEDITDFKADDWREGFLMANRLNHPWFQWLDLAKWTAHVERTQTLGMDVVAGCHTPLIRGPMIDTAFTTLREIPAMEPWNEPTQADLEMMLATMMGEPPESS
jgi:hypothetical protein